MDNEFIKQLIEFFTLTLNLILVTHLFACIWVYIGMKEYQDNSKIKNSKQVWNHLIANTDNSIDETPEGWVGKAESNNIQIITFQNLYITSFYWVMTSFTSVGYGDVTGTTWQEQLY